MFQIQVWDGNQAASYVAYAYSEVAAIYPITPSSPMAEYCDRWQAAGKKNLFGSPLQLAQMQSEAGAAAALHGALLSGVLGTTFTSSQGLLLMLPNIYRMAGELLPGVIHVAARTIATHALSIFGDHSDLYACRQTGAAIFITSSVQEVMDLSPVAHLAAIEGQLPFLNCFDGFRTSHELQKIRVWEVQDLKSLLPTAALEKFRKRALHPSHGRIYGSAQNPDIFFQTREASNPFYDALPGIVEKQITRINTLLGTHYGLFEYYGNPDATHVVVAMGSVCETIKEYLDTVRELPYGLICVHLYRPFSVTHFTACLPDTTTQVTVLSRTKEPGAPGEPLYLDVAAALLQSGRTCHVFSGRYGLSSRDTTPAQIAAVFSNTRKSIFTVGIEDDVTHLSLSVPVPSETVPGNTAAAVSDSSRTSHTISCKFWGLGGDGTVSATKNTIKLIGLHTSKNVQGYFEYDSKKSRGLTISHLRFGTAPIRSSYLISKADFVACHNPAYLHKYQMIEEVKDGGSFLLNCAYRGEALEQFLPDSFKNYARSHKISIYLIDALGIGKEIGLNNKISTILQAAFFSISGLLPAEEAKQYMKEAAAKSYGKMGSRILQMNEEAIERGFESVEKYVPADTQVDPCSRNSSDALDNPVKQFPPNQEITDFVRTIQQPVTDQRGSKLPVSAFLPYADGYTPPGTTAHERRNVATEIPEWLPENCIQCNRCSYICPHAVIRPALLNQHQLDNAPASLETIPASGLPEQNFTIAISDVDCTGCGACAAVCPGKQGRKALSMTPVASHQEKQEIFDYCKPLLPNREAVKKYGKNTVKGSQFLLPLMEFSGACAGCGETPYVKLLTQLFGSRMYIANATGCSSIWGNSSPSCAYTLDADGCGPAWSNSLFEDAAEFGFGMYMAQTLRGEDTIQWIIGGDGWAYDIGFGGLDHVLASGRNINILVLDTEVYSNTGGQASKATPLGAVAQFASSGKKTVKKNLAAMAMTYENVYVAQVAIGADFNQTLKAFSEAADYPGPSLVIAYATCIAHGIRSGMGSIAAEQKKAVETGYFSLFRFHPLLRQQGKNPFCLDSKEPVLDYREFLEGEIRYDSLLQSDPEKAQVLFRKAAADAKKRYETLKKLEAFYAPSL